MHTSETVTLDELLAISREPIPQDNPAGAFGVLAIEGGRTVWLAKPEAEALLQTVEAMRDNGLVGMADCDTDFERNSIQAFCRAAVRLSRRMEDSPDLFDRFLAQALWNYSHGVFGLDDAACWAEKFAANVAKSREIIDRVESLKAKDLDRLLEWINQLDRPGADSETSKSAVAMDSEEIEA